MTWVVARSVMRTCRANQTVPARESGARKSVMREPMSSVGWEGDWVMASGGRAGLGILCWSSVGGGVYGIEAVPRLYVSAVPDGDGLPANDEPHSSSDGMAVCSCVLLPVQNMCADNMHGLGVGCVHGARIAKSWSWMHGW
jgi:hypothetical protein